MIGAVMVGLIGDVEGELAAAADCLRLLGERGDLEVAFQLGDLRFGYGPDPETYLAALESTCAEHDEGVAKVTRAVLDAATYECSTWPRSPTR